LDLPLVCGEVVVKLVVDPGVISPVCVVFVMLGLAVDGVVIPEMCSKSGLVRKQAKEQRANIRLYVYKYTKWVTSKCSIMLLLHLH